MHRVGHSCNPNTDAPDCLTSPSSTAELITIKQQVYTKPASHRQKTPPDIHSLALYPTSETDYRKYSYFMNTIVDRNSLPEDVVTAPTLKSFQSRLSPLPN